MLEEIKIEVTKILMTVQIKNEQQVETVAETAPPSSNMQYHHAAYEEVIDKQSQSSEEKPQPFVRKSTKVGRNDPCPCGSGKKYKHCHGKLK
jgi:preprotein translocase subunit SecA